MSYIDINLRQLQSFVTVARLGSFTRAARLLHLSQPALTKQVRQLEGTLGVRLLDRTTRAVEPTRIGQELVPVVEQLLREIDAVVFNTKELAAKSRGVVRVAALPSISSSIIPVAVSRFQVSYPGISVIPRDVLDQPIIKMVKAEAVDFGVGSLNEADPELRFTLLFTDRMRVVFTPGAALERKKTTELRDLVGLPLVLMDQESSVRKLVDRAFESIGELVPPVLEATYMTTAAGMVRAGLGVTILPTAALEMGDLTGLRSRLIKNPELTREIGVIQKVGRSLSPAAESFLKSLKAVSKELTR
jgi:DNA-binding transcriptional LysR family regulator